MDSLFTNIPLEEPINICIESIHDQNDSIEVLNKCEFKELLSLATKKSCFIFNKILHKQIDGVVMGSPLGPTLANSCLCFYEKKGGQHQNYVNIFCRFYSNKQTIMF